MTYKSTERLLVIGYFGFETNQIDGQTIKTRNIYNLLSSNYETHFFDTEVLKKKKTKLFSLILLTAKYKYIYYAGGKRNLRLFFPILYFISKIRKGSIIYIAIGGWMHEFLKSKNPIYTYMVKKTKSVLVETEHLRKNLQDIGIENTEWIPNFRISSEPKAGKKSKENNELKVIFMARIVKEKGIYLLLDFYEMYKTERPRYKKNISIDFYGPVNNTDAKNFYNRISQLEPGVKYKGIIDPYDIYETLPYYDLMILPTYYEGEGFPGTILDSYLCGIPVIATAWKQIPEFVANGETGFLINYDIDDLASKIEKISNNEDLLRNLSFNAFEKAKNYSPEVALEILVRSMGLQAPRAGNINR